MKKTLLCSIAALALVLGLGACSGSTDVTQDGDDVETTITLSNYSLSIRFETDGELASIPSYGTAYIIGSWDSWKTFISLTENSDGTYTTKFSSIDTGSYEYKVVMWYTGETVDWGDDCIEITSANQQLEVLETEGNNYTKEITLTLDAFLPEPLTDEEKSRRILNVVSGYGYGDELPWDAYYLETSSTTSASKVYNTYYTTTNSDGVYGSYIHETDAGIVYKYHNGGLTWTHDTTKSADSEYNWSAFSEYSYLYALGDLTEPFKAGKAFLNSSTTAIGNYTISYSFQTVDGNYVLNAEVLDWTNGYGDEEGCYYYRYSFATDTRFNLVAIGYDTNTTDFEYSHCYASLVDYEAVQESMKGLDFKEWGYGESFTNLFSRIEQDCNYTMEINYLVYQSQFYQQLTSDSVAISLTFDYATLASATEDALVLEYGGYSGGYVSPWDAELYLNSKDGSGNDITEVYYVNSGASTLTDMYLATTWEGTWEDNVWDLGDLAVYDDSITLENILYYSYRDVEEDYYIGADALDTFINVFFCVGTSWMTDSYGFDEYFRGLQPVYCGYWPDYYDQIEVEFDDGGLWYPTYSYIRDSAGNYVVDPTTGEYVTIDGYVLQLVRTYIDVYDIGQTDVSTYVNAVKG